MMKYYEGDTFALLVNVCTSSRLPSITRRKESIFILVSQLVFVLFVHWAFIWWLMTTATLIYQRAANPHKDPLEFVSVFVVLIVFIQSMQGTLMQRNEWEYSCTHTHCNYQHVGRLIWRLSYNKSPVFFFYFMGPFFSFHVTSTAQQVVKPERSGWLMVCSNITNPLFIIYIISKCLSAFSTKTLTFIFSLVRHRDCVCRPLDDRDAAPPPSPPRAKDSSEFNSLSTFCYIANISAVFCRSSRVWRAVLLCVSAVNWLVSYVPLFPPQHAIVLGIVFLL